MNRDGTFAGKTAEGAVNGKWKLMDLAGRKYKLMWRSDDKVIRMDTVTLAADGRSISGQSSDGKAVSAKRRDANPSTSTSVKRTTPEEKTPSRISSPVSADTTEDGMMEFQAPGLELEILVKNGGLVLGEIEKNPFAAMIDLKAGDRLVAIGGKNTVGMSLERARTLLKGDNGRIPEVEIERASNRERVNFQMPNLTEMMASGDGIFTFAPGADEKEEQADGPNVVHTHDAGNHHEDGAATTTRSTSTTSRTPDDDETDKAEASRAEGKQTPVSEDDAARAIGHLKKAVSLSQAGKWADAEAEFRNSLQADPRDDGVWSLLAEACIEQKKWPEAAKAYREAIRQAPESGAHHADLANALFLQGKRGEAVKEAKEAKRLGETAHPILETLGLSG